MISALTLFKKKAGPLVEYVSESTTACLVTMVKGNLLSLTVGHLVIASQTGVIAAAIASLTLMFARSRSRWLIAAVLGVTTGIVDFFVHDGQFGPIAMEAIVTGLAAAVLSYIVGSAIYALRSTHDANDSESQ
jgi:hypothetical protein